MRTRQTSLTCLGKTDIGRNVSIAEKARYRGFLLLMSFLLVFLAACSSSSGTTNASASPSATQALPTATSAPQPTLTPDPLQAAKTRVLQIMRGMSLEQKLGQLITVEYIGSNYTGSSGLQYMVKQQFVGGILYQYINHNFDPPTNTVAGMAAFSHQVQQDAQIPLLLGTDQEGGLVNRLWTFHGPLPSAEAMAATGNSQDVYNQGKQAGQWMVQLGMNGDLAPVVDVHTVNPPILESRMFGNTPEAVSTYAGAFLDGLQQNGVAGCLKHFPGLGAVTSDPHFGLPTINRSMSDLERIDFAPYRTMIPKNHPAMIMSTDVIMTAIDPTLPAELSPKAINGVLRGELGYNGVVITDGLYMHGISERWPLSEAAVLSIIAGNDLVEGPYTVSQVASVITALKQAIQSGQLTEARIDQSVARILMMKVQFGIIK